MTNEGAIKIKCHSRHYYLGKAAHAMHYGTDQEVEDNMRVVERTQEFIEYLEQQERKAQ